MLDRLQRLFDLVVAIVFNAARVWVMKVETHRKANATLAVPDAPNSSIELVSTVSGTAFEGETKMKMDWIGKQHNKRVDALSVNKHTPLPWTMSAIPGDNCIMHKGCIIAKVVGWPGIADEEFDGNKDFIVRAVNTIDELTRQRDELIELLKDLHAFTQFALEHQIPAGQICATIGHDIGGTLAGERCFSPRVHGMSKQQAIAAAERGNG